jgi:CBS domain containing-hemolysin-like protein
VRRVRVVIGARLIGRRIPPGKGVYVIMIELSAVVFVFLGISFVCSILESVILSVNYPYIQQLVDGKHQSGKLLLAFKENIEEPVSAILTLNTISHTVGAAVAGAMADKIFGYEWIGVFSGVLTFLVLTLSEIIPKTLGAYYWKTLGPASAYFLKGMVVVMKPIVTPIRFLTRLLKPKDTETEIDKYDILSFVRMGHSRGVINSAEFEIVNNLFQLHSIKVKNIMTPRTVVFSLSPEVTIDELITSQTRLQFSRIPLYSVAEDVVVGVVLRRDIMDRVATQQTDLQLKCIAKPPEFVVEKSSVFKLLNMLAAKRMHLAVVLDEYGGYEGVVTMEDAIETLLGKEIVDEFDPAVDMQKLARAKGARFFRKQKR